MKYKFTLILVVLTIILCTCNKNSSFSGPKIYQRVDFRQRATITYTYNNDGTIAKISNSNHSDTTFSYLADTVMESDYGNNVLTGGFFYVKNGSGLADTAWGTYSNQAITYAYSYDGNNLLTQEKLYVGNINSRYLDYTYNYSNSGKNIYNLNTVAGNGSQTHDYYTFFSSNSNSIGVQDIGKYHLGASAAAPVATDININNNLDTVYTIRYRYAYDGSGRIDTMVAYKIMHGQLTGSQVDSMAFSYY